MFTRGKELLAQEKAKEDAKSKEMVKAVEKDKEYILNLVNKLEMYKADPLNNTFAMMDEKWLKTLNDTLNMIAKGYQEVLRENIYQLKNVKWGSVEEFKKASQALTDKTEGMASDMYEIKVALKQVIGIVMDNSVKERQVLDLIVKELEYPS